MYAINLENYYTHSRLSVFSKTGIAIHILFLEHDFVSPKYSFDVGGSLQISFRNAILSILCFHVGPSL